MTTIEVITTAGFNNEGRYVKRGRPITVTPERAKALYQNRLIADPALAMAGQVPENKQAPIPDNKSAPPGKTKKAAAPSATQ